MDLDKWFYFTVGDKKIVVNAFTEGDDIQINLFECFASELTESNSIHDVMREVNID